MLDDLHEQTNPSASVPADTPSPLTDSSSSETPSVADNISTDTVSTPANEQKDTFQPSGNTQQSIPLLEFRGVTKRYGSKKALDDISFTIRRGGIIGLLGPNGSGKTTIIKLICGLLTTNSGEVRINGLLPSPDTAAMISYLPDRNYLPLGDRVRDLLNLFSDFYRDFDRVKACDMLARLGISQNDRMRTMSKGTREKVQLVFVMSRRASLYVLDEPLAGVDPAARDYILSTILSNYAEGSSILLSTHLIADVERVLDDVIFLANGKAAFCASVEALKNQYGKTVDELFREVYKC